MNKNIAKKITLGAMVTASIAPFAWVCHDAYKEMQIQPYKTKIENLANEYDARNIALRSIYGKKINREIDFMDRISAPKDSMPAGEAQAQIEQALRRIDSLMAVRDSVLAAELDKYTTARANVEQKMNAIHKHAR